MVSWNINNNQLILESNVDKNVLSYTEDDLKESWNVCKYR